MATAKILHVGDDLCQRIPVLSRAGFTVLRSENSIQAISDAFADGDFFSAILFHSDLAAPAEPAIQTTRSLSTAPLVLFQNPTVLCDDHDFDLVIPALTPPDIWLQNLRELVERAHELCEQARQLRKDCESVRSHSQALRASAARNRAIAIDSDVLLPRDGGKTSGSE
ncbi:MAG TPA: hypothetical protein VF730_12655 [Terracidiphilus sp.]